jgi:thiol-disulfide isomerase/thioredoxin
MRRVVSTGIAVLLPLVFVVVADEPGSSSAREEFEALVKAQRDAQSEFSRAYQAAKTKEEKEQVSKSLGRQSSAPTHAAAFAKLVKKYPSDPIALEALNWLLMRDPSGSATAEAANSLGDELIQSERMVDLCITLRHGASRGSDELLRTLIVKNPHRSVQAQARYSQCLALKKSLDRSPSGGESTALVRRQLESLLEGLIEQYGDVKDFSGTLGESAGAQLYELRHLSVGMAAPEIVGEDLDGRPLKLSDFRGKVVLLDFWGAWCGPCMAALPEHQALLRRLDGKPFAIVGINSDRDRAAALKAGEATGITWPSWWDGGSTRGPIASRWNVQGWPTLCLLDANGVIRFKGDMLRAGSARRNAQGEFEQFWFLDQYVDQLVKELEVAK